MLTEGMANCVFGIWFPTKGSLLAATEELRTSKGGQVVPFPVKDPESAGDER